MRSRAHSQLQFDLSDSLCLSIIAMINLHSSHAARKRYDFICFCASGLLCGSPSFTMQFLCRRVDLRKEIKRKNWKNMPMSYRSSIILSIHFNTIANSIKLLVNTIT